MPDFDDYKRKYIAQYENQQFEPLLVMARRSRVLKSMANHPHDQILEIGCGLEPLFPDIDDCSKYTLVEPVADFADRARQQIADDLAVTVLTGELEDLAATMDPDFDFIVCSSLLHEVADPEALLAAIATLCSDHTVCHFNVPNVRSFHRLLALEAGLVDDLFAQSELERRFSRQTRFDEQSFLETLVQARFEPLKHGSYFVKPFTHKQMDALLKAGIIDQRVVTALGKMTKYMPDLGCELYADTRRA